MAESRDYDAKVGGSNPSPGSMSAFLFFAAMWRRYRPSIDIRSWPWKISFGPSERNVSAYDYAVRLSKCFKCCDYHRSVEKCGHCGCPILSKALMSTESCPRSIWEGGLLGAIATAADKLDFKIDSKTWDELSKMPNVIAITNYHDFNYLASIALSWIKAGDLENLSRVLEPIVTDQTKCQP